MAAGHIPIFILTEADIAAETLITSKIIRMKCSLQYMMCSNLKYSEISQLQQPQVQ